MKLVIIGNGVAGVMTARYVAETDPSVEIVIYSDEPYSYYPRPRLIDFLAGEVPLEDMSLYDEAWYQKRGIRARLGCAVTAIHPDEHQIDLADGSSDHYDRLVLATGAHNWVPPIPGADLPGVYTLRSLADAQTLRQRADQIAQAVMIGGGLLGLDMSAALRAHHVGVTVVEALPWLLPRQLDREGAAVLQRAIEQMGIEVVTGDQIAAIAGNGHVERVELKSGRSLPAEMIIVSTGIRSNLRLAQDAGLACNRGVVVDEQLRTNVPDIYAVGDAAEFSGRVWGIIPAAIAQARVAAAQLTGHADNTYTDIVPSTTLKVTGIDVASIGEVHPEGEGYSEIRYTDAERGVYKKLVVYQGRVVGAILIGDRSDLRGVNALIAAGTDVSAQIGTLLTPGTDLLALAKGATVQA